MGSWVMMGRMREMFSKEKRESVWDDYLTIEECVGAIDTMERTKGGWRT
jgi:hypothetical protein